MTRHVTGLLLASLMTLALACSGDEGSKDGSARPREGGVDATSSETVAADEPFGRACGNIGEKCKDQGYSFDLFCVAIPGGAAGNGFCTPQCTDVGTQCVKVPSGQFADCVLQGSIAKFCAFLCVSGSSSWTCPPALKCGAVNMQGTALCVPR